MNANVRATELIGPNPKGAVRRVSLAVREALSTIPAGQPATVVVGCSGGPDSLALLVAATDYARRQGWHVESLTVDHGIRSGSAEEAQQVSALARTLGVNTAQVLPLTRQESNLGPEGNAREGRHQALQRACRVLKRAMGHPVYLLLGHTLDDQAETVLLGLARGSGLRSLAGMEPISQPATENDPTIMRPLLQCRRHDTVLTCEKLGLPAIDDPTNRADGPWRTADGSALRRAAVREFALPSLAAALGQDPAPALMRTASQLRRDNDCLDEIASELLRQVTLPAGVSIYTGRTARLELDWEAMQGLHPAIISRTVRLAALQAGANGAALNSTHIEALTALVNDYKGQGPVYLPGGVVAARIRLDKPTEHGQPGLSVPTQGAPLRLRFS
ncbi:tRNA lysidine(34) synthetase TilS [Boudabousia liubingyangii]|uniref:tRNA(Ile)-lysidine synthase n=1 Tax=Boudabousia liubingyangii TaxID=1921764 RepID=A0A1Q5PLP4_9ACTO|nr:tRNA lysidine(34) synthetase TilS [Boudabousia liubingyangii]OKL47978.1 tRNA lysidine(34) synthetase TilS [Boudabousia liubingyangii]